MINPKIDLDPRNDLDTLSDDELAARESLPPAFAEPVTEAEYAAAMACPCRAPDSCARCDSVMARLLEGAGLGAGRVAA